MVLEVGMRFAVAAAVQEDEYVYDDDDYDAAAEEYDDYPPENMGPEEAYYIVDLDPQAPGNTIQRDYMKCFLPSNPEPANDGDWRVVDPGLQV